MTNSWRAIGRLCCAVSVLALAGAAPGATAVLDTAGFWRCWQTWKAVHLRRADGRLEFVSVDLPSRGPAKVAPVEQAGCTPLPPDGWAEGGFDDGRWARARGPLFTRGTREIALICARGKFQVSDPAAAGELKLSLSYRGGAVVYVNGREIARGHLPAGKIDLEAPAEDYPPEAYVAPDGNLLRVGFREPEKYPERFALRTRRLECTIAPSRLRKGVNVLAVELHRAPVAEAFYTARYRESFHYAMWDMIGLERVELTAAGGEGVVPNVERPAGVQLWNHPVFVSVHSTDFGDPAEPLRPIELAAARNGAVSGQVVLGSTAPIRGVRAAATELKTAAGAVIPAAAVQVRYGQLGDHGASHNENHQLREPVPFERTRRRFDALIDSAPAEVPADPQARAAVLPIWLTVRVPPDAKAGDYTGRLTVAAADLPPADVPVTLTVADWALPDPKQYATHVGLIQSPETLAIRYGAPMWSEAHWRLIDRSFELLGQVGCKVIYLPLLRRTYFGNEQSMVRWVGPEGGPYRYDFSIVERYLDTAVRHLGRVPVVCAYCWDVNTGSKYFGSRTFAENAGLPITRVDPATGKPVDATGPTWGQAAAFWKPVLEGLRGVLAKRGLAKSLMVGIAGDRQPNRDAVDDLKAAAPDAPWVCSSHSSPDEFFGQPVGYRSEVWGVTPAPDPAVARYCGWRALKRIVAFPRAGSAVVGTGMRTDTALAGYRLAVESAITARGKGEGLVGIGRCGADFWPVLEGARGREAVLGRFPETSAWHGGWLRNSTPYVLGAGPDGPVATVRFEMLREGVQECQARVFLEEVLGDPQKRARLGEALAARCRELLDERVRAHRRAIAGGGRYLTWLSFAGPALPDRTAALYAAAAAVAEAAAR